MVYFESGHSYSKGIKVIPIGLFGIDLQSITPPLSLLQGFNIKDKNGLNNIISVINKEFLLTIPESFTNSDLDELLRFDDFQSPDTFMNIFENVIVHFPRQLNENFENRTKSLRFHEDLKVLLHTLKIEFNEYNDSIHFEGALIRKINPISKAYDHIFEFDPISFPNSLNLIKKCVEVAYNLKTFSIMFIFKQDIQCYYKMINLTSRLMKYDCHLSKNMIRYRDIDFIIEKNEKQNNFTLTIVFEIENLTIEIIKSLINMLFEANVCYINRTDS